MAKRLTDTEKWHRPWFRKLPSEYKLLWTYIIDQCDSIGIWHCDLELAAFLLGCKFDEKKAVEILDKQIRILGDGSKWLVEDFVRFQYGELKETNNMHGSIIKKLQEVGLYDHETNAVSSPDYSNSSPDVEISGASISIREQVKEKEVKDTLVKRFAPPSVEEVRAYCEELVAKGKKRIDPEAWLDYYTSKGWKIGNAPMKDWRAAVRTWERNSYGSNQSGSSSGRIVGQAAAVPGKYDEIEQGR